MKKLNQAFFFVRVHIGFTPPADPGGIPPPRLNARRDRLTVAKMHKNGTPKKLYKKTKKI